MSGNIWGIFTQTGTPVLEADSVDSFSFRRDTRVSTAPQEQGAFMSYNKVQDPYISHVTYAINKNRAGFLQKVDAAVKSLDLYVVTTPDATYPNSNLIHYDYDRTNQQGTTLILVTVYLEEIRQGSGPQLQNTQSLNGATPNVSSQVQPQNSGPGGGPNLVTGLSPQAPVPPSSTNLETPQIGPLNYNATNLPQVPNTWNLLTNTQQSTVVSAGVNAGSTSALAYPPDPSGNTTVQLINPGP